MRLTIPCVIVMTAMLLSATPAFADATVFLGATTTPANRLVRGFSAGVSLLVFGFEFEYANTTDDPRAAAPSLTTGSGNVLLQTPFEIGHVQLYVTGGLGGYSETLGLANQKGVAVNTGGGVKVSLAGPLRLRVDYRAFKLRSGALYSSVQRVYAGLNVKF